MRLSRIMGLSVLLAAVFGGSAAALADAIPYPDIGTPNPVTTSFTAIATGDVIAYFAGSTAAYDNQLGLLDNGVLTSAGYGLDNHSSAIGQSFNLGPVNAGDSLVFVLHSLTLGMDAYSDPSMNAGYDLDGSVGHNHVYSTDYSATSPVFPGVPAGIYVAFEDLQFPFSDFNYFDETFVFTIASNTPPAVPEPSSLALFGAALLFCGIAGWRGRSA